MRFKRTVCVLTALCVVFLGAFAMSGCSESEREARSKYEISASVDTEHMTVDAVCDIDYVNRSEVELDEVWFHLYPAAYRSGARFTPVSASEVGGAYPSGVSYGGIEIESVTGGEYEIGGSDEDVLIVKLPSAVMPTVSTKISVKYKLRIPNMRHRFGYCDGKINLGNWFPVECVYDRGFVADPYYSNGDPFCLPICDYKVSISAPSDYIVAMPAPASRTDGEDGVSVTSCSLDAARDFAAVLGKFETVSGEANGVAVTYYYTSDDKAREHLKAACDALVYFSDSFGAYPYESYAVVQTPFNQGGMEYTGLVYVSDAARDELASEVIIHETAHQWWYGIVGNDQVREAWLDEALAEYSTSLFYRNNPEYGVKYEDRIADAMGGYSLYCELSRCENSSMNRSVGDFATSTEYTYMTYVKGQLMYDSVLHAVGEKSLVAGLRAYAANCAYDIAKADDLIAALEKASGRSLKSLMSSFIDGTALLYSVN